MKKIVFVLLVIIVSGFQSNAQKYITKNGSITFLSDGLLEKIEAKNNQVNSALDSHTGGFVFKVLLKSFVFEKALMQEHFNENYVESDKYPTSFFKGKIADNSKVDYSKPGSYYVIVEGDLTLHGITKHITEKGQLIISEGSINGVSTFYLKLADYDISIPRAVEGKIAESIEVTVNVMLKPLNK